jgi:hypothetical protein
MDLEEPGGLDQLYKKALFGPSRPSTSSVQAMTSGMSEGKRRLGQRWLRLIGSEG